MITIFLKIKKFFYLINCINYIKNMNKYMKIEIKLFIKIYILKNTLLFQM